MDQHFKELVRDLQMQRDEVKAALEQREKLASENIKEIVQELEERSKLLQEDKDTRDQIHQISDSVLFLQVNTAMGEGTEQLIAGSLLKSLKITPGGMQHFRVSQEQTLPCTPDMSRSWELNPQQPLAPKEFA